MLVLDYRYINDIIPQVEKRTPARLDWLYLQSTQLEDLYTRLFTENTDFKFEANHNAQILSLEHYINNKLSPIVDIYIEDGIIIKPTYFYREDETFDKPVYMFTEGETITDDKKIFLFTESEDSSNQYDYGVFLATVDAGLELQLQAILDRFNPSGKIYSIITY